MGTMYAFIIIGRHSIPSFWSKVLLHACIAIQVNIAVLHTSALESWLLVQMVIACMHCNNGQIQVEIPYR